MGDKTEKGNYKLFKGHDPYSPKELIYDTSWDWLMPVVEKINVTKMGDEEFDVIIYKADCHINNSREIIFEHSKRSKDSVLIECVYSAVVEFIRMYNHQ